MTFLWQHRTIRGTLSENINTIVSTASTTSRDGQRRPSVFTISATGEGETGLNISGRDSDCHVRWHSFHETRTHACVERGKWFSKEKQKEKTHQRKTKRITCSFLAFWMMMESHEVPFKEMLIHDFSYQGALFYNNAKVDKILSAGYWKSKKYTHHSFFRLRNFSLSNNTFTTVV